MLYIIDGYNVMHALEEGSGIDPGELEGKRRSLVESVISQTAVSGDEAVIVFDSMVSKTPERHPVPNTDVVIYFASAAESADIVIGKLVRERLDEVEGIRVVSGDWEVQKGALKSRVERIPPRHFIADLKKFEKKVAKRSEKDTIRWKLEHKLDVETLAKLERMRRGSS